MEDKVNSDLCATLFNFIVGFGCEIGCTADFEIGCQVTRILKLFFESENSFFLWIKLNFFFKIGRKKGNDFLIIVPL